MSFNYDLYIDQHLWILYTGIALTLISLFSFEFKNNKNLAIFLLVAGAFSIRFFISLIDPFLHLWDEQFHALVAKNMLQNPFKPMLLTDPILSYNPNYWSENHIWLHKQPLFLWQIALSFKLFGVTTLALRIPNILMSTIILLFIYRIGSLVYSKKAGFYGAVLFSGSTFIVEMVAGRIPTDHNDIAFMFYATASIWAWFEFYNSKNRRWVFLIGIFSGFSILVKWLPGLLVYSGWFIVILINHQPIKKQLVNFAISLGVTAIVAIPWQLFTFLRYNDLSLYEFNEKSKHFYEVVEGHVGDWSFHFQQIDTIYGTDFIFIILICFIFFFLAPIKKTYKVALSSWVAIIYLFYSVAATKMIAFTMVIAPLVYTISGIGLAYLFSLISKSPIGQKVKLPIRHILAVAVLFYFFIHFLNHDRISLKNRSDRKELHQKEISNTMLYKTLPSHFPGEKTIVFNAPYHECIKIIFHTGMRSRSSFPTKEQVVSLKEKDMQIAIFDDGLLPEYLIEDTSIAKIKSSVWLKSISDSLMVIY